MNIDRLKLYFTLSGEDDTNEFWDLNEDVECIAKLDEYDELDVVVLTVNKATGEITHVHSEAVGEVELEKGAEITVCFVRRDILFQEEVD